MVAHQDLLKEAVFRHNPLSFNGMLDRLFHLWFRGFVYNQIWEDPRVDREGLRLDHDSKLLTISSGGCNVLNYLVDEPGSIEAVDLNPHHIYLTRLKIAALRYLPTYEAFFQFFGCADSNANLDNYQRYIRQHLDEATRSFWEGGTWVRRKLRGPRIDYFKKNLYNHARLGYFMRFLHQLAKLVRKDPTAILRAKTQQEQEEVFEQLIGPFFDNSVVRFLGNMPFILFGLGIPPHQYNKIRQETGSNILGMYRERAKRLACGFPLEDNYFTWMAFGRSYDTVCRQAVPDYLKEDHYETLKSHVENVHTEITGLTPYLQSKAAGSLNRFVFLDSQDWMPKQAIAELWTEIDRVGEPGTRIIFRTAASESPVETALPASLRERFVYEKELGDSLFPKDRAAIYGGFHIYSKPV